MWVTDVSGLLSFSLFLALFRLSIYLSNMNVVTNNVVIPLCLASCIVGSFTSKRPLTTHSWWLWLSTFVVTTNYREGGTPNVSPPCIFNKIHCQGASGEHASTWSGGKGLACFPHGIVRHGGFLVQTRRHRQRNTGRGFGFFAALGALKAARGL